MRMQQMRLISSESGDAMCTAELQWTARRMVASANPILEVTPKL
jgi:hypothetical protein